MHKRTELHHQFDYERQKVAAPRREPAYYSVAERHADSTTFIEFFKSRTAQFAIVIASIYLTTNVLALIMAFAIEKGAVEVSIR